MELGCVLVMNVLRLGIGMGMGKFNSFLKAPKLGWLRGKGCFY